MSVPVQLSLDLRYPQQPEAETASVPIDRAFPEAAANQLARQESFNKHLYRPNTYLHKWWARRCGTTFRYILKQLVADPSRRDFYEPGGLAGKVVLDPMMGGGTTLHEAIRMGANVIGADIDPIPVVQARATLTVAELKDITPPWRTTRSIAINPPATCNSFSGIASNAGDSGPKGPWSARSAPMVMCAWFRWAERLMPESKCSIPMPWPMVSAPFGLFKAIRAICRSTTVRLTLSSPARPITTMCSIAT